jgi:bifunctional UDP-N-acetylglucosamine pyrophosphorylase / glucosamine-1-phosphate N-acetyltransferase
MESKREAQNKLIKYMIEQGLQVEDPVRVDVRGTLQFGSNVNIDINVIFKGDVVLGNDITIAPNCIIEDCKIDSNVEIKENSTISSSIIGKGCRIGPYARIRPESVIGASSHIGNFVEIKNTVMGAGCKINHHSFVGDAILGRDVIIAAGSITCNFTGSRTESTVIGDHAFIGSGVQLIAPCRIGEGAFIAAGSTITQEVPAKKLALCRAQAMVLKDLPEKNS